MRRWFWLFVLMLAPLAFSQNPGVVIVGTAPSGACPQGVPGRLVNSTGQIWTCQSIIAGTGTWTLETGGGGGGSGNASYTGTLNTVPCGTGVAHTMADCTAGALIGAATGGVQGTGTLNVSGGFYVNGVLVSGTGLSGRSEEH